MTNHHFHHRRRFDLFFFIWFQMHELSIPYIILKTIYKTFLPSAARSIVFDEPTYLQRRWTCILYLALHAYVARTCTLLIFIPPLILQSPSTDAHWSVTFFLSFRTHQISETSTTCSSSAPTTFLQAPLLPSIDSLQSHAPNS